MFITFVACMLAAGLNTLIHYEVLSALSDHLNTLHVPKRSKLLVVILATLVAHAVEMAVYGVAIYGLIAGLGIGGLTGSGGFSLQLRSPSSVRAASRFFFASRRSKGRSPGGTRRVR